MRPFALLLDGAFDVAHAGEGGKGQDQRHCGHGRHAALLRADPQHLRLHCGQNAQEYA